MDRRVLRDDQWERIAPLLPGKVGDAGRTEADNRLFVEAVLWIVRVGAPWRDLPEAFGNWNSVFQRFRRWVKAGVFDQIFEALSDDADFEYVIVDGTIVRVHQHGTGERRDAQSGHRPFPWRPDDQDVALVDALGNLVRFVLLPGQRHDSAGAAPLLTDLDFSALLADKAFDSDGIRADLDDRGARRDPAQSQPGHLDPLRLRDVQVAPSGRKLLLQDQGVPPHRYPLRQNRHELLGNHTTRRVGSRNPMNVNRP